MTMTNATSSALPFATPSQTPASTELADAPKTAHSPALDFWQALAQMLDPAAAQGVDPSLALGAAIQSDGPAIAAQENVPSDLLDPALATLMPLPGLPLAAGAAAAQAAQDADPLALLGLAPRAEAAVAAGVHRTLTETAAAGETPAPEMQPTQIGVLTGDASAPRSDALEPALHRPMQSHVGTRAWTEELGSRLMLMTDKGLHTASLRLSPEHLGPIEIRIALREDQATVWFGAAHADTRAAIEQALPRLRELFGTQGMVLTDAGVSGEAPKQGAFEWRASGHAGADIDSAEEASPSVSSVRVQTGLLDAYA